MTLPKAVSRKLTYNAMRKIQRRSHVETGRNSVRVTDRFSQ